MPASRSRRFVSGLLGTLGILLILLAVLLGYARRSVFDERAFAGHVAESLEDPRVAAFVAEQIADAIVSASPDLVGVRPIIVGLTRSIVASEPFRAAARRSARTLHKAIMDGTAREVVLTVKDVGAVVESAASMSPGIAKKIPKGVGAAIGKLDELPAGDRVVALVRFGHRVRALAIALLLAGIALCAVSVRLADERRRALLRLGLALTVIALLLAVIAKFGGDVLSLFARHRERAPALAGLGDAFLGGLMVWAIGLGLSGLVLASASASLLDKVPLADLGGGAWRWLTGPQPRMRSRLARGGVGALAGTAVLLWPLPALTVSAWGAGLVVAFAGMREAFVAALHLLPEMQPKAHEQREARRQAVGRGAMAFVGLVVLAVAGVTTWMLTRTPDTTPAATEIRTYNGLASLGDRTLDQVVFPATHNAMGSPDTPGWMFPNQSADIASQLDDGIRAFLIDAHYGVPIGDKVKTEIEDEAGSMSKYEAVVGKEGMDAAVRIRDRLTGQPTGPRDIYMCHGFCELGALRLEPVFTQMRDFLVAHPGEVILIVIQDEGVPTTALADVFKRSGLIDFVYRGPAGPKWPTLREMVDSDQRVVVMTENQCEGVDWVHPAFQVMQETPYTFHDKSQFSNQPNRGGTGGSIYQMNHWIESTPMPKPSNADTVNAHDFLLTRIRNFRKVRGHLPNVVAVDFYREGDLVAVCRELNEEPLPAPKPRKGRQR